MESSFREDKQENKDHRVKSRHSSLEARKPQNLYLQTSFVKLVFEAPIHKNIHSSTRTTKKTDENTSSNNNVKIFSKNIGPKVQNIPNNSKISKPLDYEVDLEEVLKEKSSGLKIKSITNPKERKKVPQKSAVPQSYNEKSENGGNCQPSLNLLRLPRSVSDLEVNVEIVESYRINIPHQHKEINVAGEARDSITHVPDDDVRRQNVVREPKDLTKLKTDIVEKRAQIERQNPKPIFNLSKTTEECFEEVQITYQTRETAKPIRSTTLQEKTSTPESDRQGDFQNGKTEKIKTFPLKENLLKYIIYLPAALCVLFILYAVVPVGLLFGAHDYDEKSILANLNFCLLGAIQSFVEIVYLYKLIDLPIKKKVREIEGRNKGLINLKKYIVISPLNIAAIIAFSAGLQLLAGNFMNLWGIVPGPKEIFICCIIITAIKGVVWFTVIKIKTPSSMFKDKKLVRKELKQISKFRKEFVEDMDNLRQELRQMELNRINAQIDNQCDSPGPNNIPNTTVLTMPDANLVRFSRGNHDYGKEFKMLRIQSFRVFTILVFGYIETFALYYLVKGISQISSVPLSLFTVVSFPIVSFIFGLFDFKYNIDNFQLSTMKITSMVIASALYRFLYFRIDNKSTMMGLLGLKVAYKILVYFFGLVFGGDLINNARKKLKFSTYGTSNSEMEVSRLNFRRYIFEKFMIIQKVDLFFAFGTILPLACSESWVTHLNFGLGLACGDMNFYIRLVFADIGFDMALPIAFLFWTKYLLKNTSKSFKRDLFSEIFKAFNNTKSITISLEIMMLYLLFFVFMNKE